MDRRFIEFKFTIPKEQEKMVREILEKLPCGVGVNWAEYIEQTVEIASADEWDAALFAHAKPGEVALGEHNGALWYLDANDNPTRLA